MITRIFSRSAVRKGFLVVASGVLALTVLAGCAQNEPNAADATTESATPTGDTGEPPVAESSSVNDASDGTFTLDVTPALENLKTSADVKTYVENLQQQTDDLVASYDHYDADTVAKANDLINTLSEFNHYLPTLQKDEVIKPADAEAYSNQVEQMLLSVDALVAS